MTGFGRWMKEGDGWLRESASRRAGVAQSPDGRRAITIFDPPLKELCRDQHTVRARHPEGSSVSLARAGPRTSESRITCHHRGSDPFQSRPPTQHTLRGIAPGFQALKFNHTWLMRRTRVSGPRIQSYSAHAENQGFRPTLKSRGRGNSTSLGDQTGISMASLSGATRGTTVP